MKFFYAFLSSLLIGGVAHAEIRVGGSDLLASHFGPALAEYAESRGLDVKADFIGSHPGMEGLRNGKLHLAILAIPDGAALPEGELRTHYIGSKVLAVVVPESNPLSEVTLRQLGGVFGESDATNITRWGQLGLSGEWSSRSILVNSVSAAEHTLARDLFRHTVLQSRNMRRNLAESNDIEGIRRRFQQDPNGIALLHQVPADRSGLKILSVARGQDDLAYPPTREAVANNNYPLRLPLYLVFSGGNATQLKELLRFIASEEAAEALQADGLMPMPAVDRQSLYFEFERL